MQQPKCCSKEMYCMYENKVSDIGPSGLEGIAKYKNIIRYCDASCQRLHWPEHKPFCNVPGSELI